jgi:hypothetical protein
VNPTNALDDLLNTWQRPPRQDSLLDQVSDLHRIAVRLGMYDAADLLAKSFKAKR